MVKNCLFATVCSIIIQYELQHFFYVLVTTGKAGGAGVAPSKGQIQAAPVCQPLGKVGEGADKNVANTKEKTPMCLINELARYNKVCLVIKK